MSFSGFQLEYSLEGSLNYIAYKDRMEAVFEDNGLMEFIDSDVPKPNSSDAALLDTWKKKVAKTRRILLEGVKDHIVKPSRESHLICNLEGFERSFPKQHRP